MSAKDESYLAAREAFAALVPELDEISRSKYFVLPAERANLESDNHTMPDPQRTRKVVQGLAALGESYATEHRPADAAEVLLTGFRLGRKLYGKDGVMGHTMCVACQRIVFFAWCESLPPSAALTTEQWRSAFDGLQPALPSADPVGRTLEDELFLSVNTIDDLRRGKLKRLEGVEQLPRFLGRERRIVINAYTHLLDGRKPGDAIEVSSNMTHGVLSSAMLSNLERYSRQASLNRRLMLALDAAVAVTIYHKEKGSYPQSLNLPRRN